VRVLDQLDVGMMLELAVFELIVLAAWFPQVDPKHSPSALPLDF
jgi:hypothetical protein